MAVAGSHSSIRAVTLDFMGGYGPVSPAYDIRFSDDDKFLYNGYHDVPNIGVHRGRFEFALLAEWLDTQAITSFGHVDLGGGVDCPSFHIMIERHRAPNTIIAAGLPLEDPEVWGIVSALEGATSTALTEHAVHRSD